MNYQKEITSNLMHYLIDGELNGAYAPDFDGTSFLSESINNKRFQFIRKYEDVEAITDKNIIPVLVVTTPQMYLNGRILYKGKYQDLKTFLVTDKRSTCKIKHFVIPDVKTINGNSMGRLTYNLYIDSLSTHDPYGFIADEINQIIKNMYYKKECGGFYSFNVDNTTPLYFVPQSITPIDTGALLRRIFHTYTVRSCNFA